MAAAPNSSQNHPPSPTEPGSPSLSPSSDRSASPPPRPASLPPPPPASAPSASRRLAAPIWNHEETLALIDAYRDKWYALRRGNLRAPHWEEVADDVARRCPCGLSPPKTAVQCRHKVEKIRKRYRSEMQKSLRLDPSLAPVSSWVYFPMMDAMEHGGGSGPRRPLAFPSIAAPPPPSDDDDDDDLDEDNNDDDDARRGSGVWGNSRAAHPQMANGRGGIGELTFSIPKAVRSKISRSEDRSASNYIMSPNPTSRFFKGRGGGSARQPAMEKKRRRVETEQTAVSDMVAAVRMLGDGFLRMEQRKLEMAREMEKVRMEMEMKRTQLILDSQRRILDAFLKGFSAKKRTKVLPEDS